mmetsp:Transcript_18030/g.37978  ORF Transcript_18030/g.37978 Transcript_18030/m.37978 type:complete len:82 (-) Transcript_18030:411-656(-)
MREQRRTKVLTSSHPAQTNISTNLNPPSDPPSFPFSTAAIKSVSKFNQQNRQRHAVLKIKTVHSTSKLPIYLHLPTWYKLR